MITIVTVPWEHMANLDPEMNVLEAIKIHYSIPAGANFLRLETDQDDDCYHFVFKVENE